MTGHNRFHPDIEPVARVRPGEEITLDCVNGVGLRSPLDTAVTAADVAAIDLGDPHMLSGPVYVEGAEPGDVLEVEVVGLTAGEIGVTPLIPGFGWLADLFPEAHLVIWRLEDGIARSDQLPGVAVPADMFPGVIGVAPSHERLAGIRRREQELADRGGAVADLAPDRAVPPVAAEGLRTIPPREIGGNMDTRGIVAGSRLSLPVDVPGALFSAGDLHFAQGDGEVCGTAIEMDGTLTVRFALRRDGAWTQRFPSYTTPARRSGPTMATTGLPLREDGGNESMDLSLAARNALLEMIGWLTATHGFSREAAYALCSACVDLRLSEVVDVPNPLVSAVLPLDVFETRAV